MLDDLVAVIETLKDRIQQHKADLQGNETRTRMALIDPLLTALGWNVADPSLVTPEYDVSGKRADYALLDDQHSPVVFLEAKRLGELLSNHRSQVVAYASELGIRYPALTNGDNWEVYDNSKLVPIEQQQILKVSITDSSSATCALQLLMLWRATVSLGASVAAEEPIVQLGGGPGLTGSSSIAVDQHPPPPPLPPAPGWTSLADFQAKSGSKPPPIAQFPGGEEVQIKAWSSLLIQVAEWLVRNGHLSPSNCPIWMGKKRYTVHTEAVHSTSVAFKATKQLSNHLFLETNLSAPAVVSVSCDLVKQLGQDPSHIHFQTG